MSKKRRADGSTAALQESGRSKGKPAHAAAAHGSETTGAIAGTLPTTNLKPNNQPKALARAGGGKAQRKGGVGAGGEDAAAEATRDTETKAIMGKYRRGDPVPLKKMKDKKLRGQMRVREEQIGRAMLTAAQAEKWLLPESVGYVEAEGVERTHNFTQAAMVEHVPLAVQRHAFDLKLDHLGPYRCSYSLNGRSLVLAGRKGHVAMLDWRRAHMVCELQVQETVRDVCFLHNELFFATAQKKSVFLYDKRGIELHCLKEHVEPIALAFLPHHFLLASVGKAGALNYIDTSTGLPVVNLRTAVRRGRPHCMAADGATGVVGVGHAGGTVTLWTPNLAAPAATWLAHRGPIMAVAFDAAGSTAATASVDGSVRLWDLRTFRERRALFAPSPPSSLAFSQRGLLAVAHGSGVEIWHDNSSGGSDGVWAGGSAAGDEAGVMAGQRPYLRHRVPHGWAVEEVAFCPFEDALGVGHAGGFSSLLVPGAGEPNPDAFAVGGNPYETPAQRREAEVALLMDKLPPATIALGGDGRIGAVQKGVGAAQAELAALENAANASARKRRRLAGPADADADGDGEGAEDAAAEAKRERRKAKGRGKSSKRFKRKLLNVVDEKRQRMLEEAKRKREVALAEKKRREQGSSEGAHTEDAVPLALARFK